jgi:hypothetical protein
LELPVVAVLVVVAAVDAKAVAVGTQVGVAEVVAVIKDVEEATSSTPTTTLRRNGRNSHRKNATRKGSRVVLSESYPS